MRVSCVSRVGTASGRRGSGVGTREREREAHFEHAEVEKGEGREGAYWIVVKVVSKRRL
jgi:hypothetical protein